MKENKKKPVEKHVRTKKIDKSKTTKRNIVSHVKVFIKLIYSIISVISTLTIFAGVFIYVFGSISKVNISDNDLTMDRIMSQIPPNVVIKDIIIEDLHGLGNDSIIVIANDNDFFNKDEQKEMTNQLIIFDKIENQMLNSIYNLFGYGSTYKMSYIFSLQHIEFTSLYYSINIIDIKDITGDNIKEIMVSFMSSPAGTELVYEVGIFSYDYSNNQYYLLSTIPDTGYRIAENWGIAKIYHYSDKINIQDYEQEYINYYDNDKKFALSSNSARNTMFITDLYGSKNCVVTCNYVDEENLTRVSPHRYAINVFTPKFDNTTKTIEWSVLFSMTTDDYIENITKDYASDFIEKNIFNFINNKIKNN